VDRKANRHDPGNPQQRDEVALTHDATVIYSVDAEHLYSTPLLLL
jgi:hypothetical protein